MLSGKQMRYLRSLAHKIDPTFHVGKGGMNGNMTKQINEILKNHELVKIHILQNNFDDKNDLAQELASDTQSELVQVIGSMIVLYKEVENNKEITLP
ncbi:ribosome assembly RNA-binding protein YhbY [Staphylococcus saccharolyticus]|uniref:ribosome assembly RNA-binding protein YhbY n=1 Tax=Staphylococcus saccharolyticus TaxID=33028 RepID=UPI0032DF3A6F